MAAHWIAVTTAFKSLIHSRSQANAYILIVCLARLVAKHPIHTLEFPTINDTSRPVIQQFCLNFSEAEVAYALDAYIQGIHLIYREHHFTEGEPINLALLSQFPQSSENLYVLYSFLLLSINSFEYHGHKWVFQVKSGMFSKQLIILWIASSIPIMAWRFVVWSWEIMLWCKLTQTTNSHSKRSQFSFIHFQNRIGHFE